MYSPTLGVESALKGPGQCRRPLCIQALPDREAYPLPLADGATRIELRSINGILTAPSRCADPHWLAGQLARDRDVAVAMNDGALVVMRIGAGRVEAAMTVPAEGDR